MGCTCPKCEETICYDTEKLKKKIQLDIKKIDYHKNLNKNEINKVEKSIENTREIIHSKITKENNLNIRTEIDNYYNLVNELKQTKNKCHFDTLIKERENFMRFIEELGKHPSDERIEAIKREHNEIKKNKLWEIFYGEKITEKNNSDLNKNYKFEEVEEENPEKEKLIQFCNLNDKIITEIDGIEERENKFENTLNKLKTEYEFSFSLEKYLNKFEESIKSFKKNLNFYQDNIKEIIEKIIQNKIELNYVNNEYDALNNKINECINGQDNYEKELIKEKNIDFEKAKIGYIKCQINLKFNDLRKLIDKMQNIKIKVNNNITKCKNLSKLIIQKENQNFFISFQIKDKQEKSKTYKEHKNNINMHIESLNNQIKIINKIVNNFETLESNNNKLNYFSDHSFEKSNKQLESVQELINNTIQNINDIKNFLEQSEKFLNIEEEKMSDLIKDYYYVIIDSSNKIHDKIYLNLRLYEEKILIDSFKGNKLSFEKELCQNHDFQDIPQITNDIINEIYLNQRIDEFCENKIIKKIKDISNDDEKFKINHLNILVVGRKGIGKSTLIKYMLELSDDEFDNMNDDVKDFVPFISNKVKYLKLLRVKGVGYDKECTPKSIKTKIQKYIDATIDDTKNQSINNIIHCIWYCLTDTRFEGEEKSLFKSLQKLYGDNNIPIILVYTKSTDKNRYLGMVHDLKKDNIKNDCIEVIAKEMNLTRGIKKSAFGKEELEKTTLKKCKEAFKGDMMKIMTQQISKDITKIFFLKNDEVMNRIICSTYNNFVEKYIEPLGDGDFFLYINNLFFKYLSLLNDVIENITNKSKNLMFESKFMTSINKIYNSYKNYVKDLIKPIIEEKAKEFIEYQAFLEKVEGNMNLDNRRTLGEFKKTIEIFLKKNYYFIVQNYIINHIINSPNNYLFNFLSSFFKKIKNKFLSFSNKDYLNYSNQISNKIRNCLEYCFKKKLSSFSKRNNIGIDNDDDNLGPLRENMFFVDEINFENDYNNIPLNNNFKNTDSLIFNKIDNTKKYSLPKICMYLKFHFDYEHKSSFINKELNLKMENFILNIKSQNSSINNNLDDNDIVFNFFLNEIKGNLLDYINSYQSKYFEEINTSYNLGKKNNNIIFDKNEVESQIEWKKIELYYKNVIHNSFIDNYIKNNKYENLIKLKYITIILAGKSGVGKSTLINCFFKRQVAVEGLYKVCTMDIKSHKMDFLNIIDTRGYELDPKYPPEECKKDVLNKIELGENQNNYNELIHCIWFCVHSNSLDDTEKKALKELKNNKYNVPLIVVFTNAQSEDDVNNMKKEIYNLFHEDIFIDVLGRKTDIIPAYGLDDLFNKTLKVIKLNNTSNYFMRVKNKFKDIKNSELTKVIANIKKNIINKIVEYLFKIMILLKMKMVLKIIYLNY